MAHKAELPAVGPNDYIAPGTRIVGFKGILPVANIVCRQHADANLERDFPEALGRRRHLTIVANGPSARGVNLAIHSPTLALNGSLGLFEEQGIVPDFWACCDPQELVADFLPEHPDRFTTYLVASKCHPRVFDKLAQNRCKVRVWHLPDIPAPGKAHVPLCSTITICASWLMFRLGFTDFDYYGWDGCFMDGRHHAMGDADWGEPPLYLNYDGKVVNGEIVGGRTFATTRAWALEAEGAGQFFQLAKYFDIGVKLHGDGMYRYVKEFNEKPGDNQ